MGVVIPTAACQPIVGSCYLDYHELSIFLKGGGGIKIQLPNYPEGIYE